MFPAEPLTPSKLAIENLRTREWGLSSCDSSPLGAAPGSTRRTFTWLFSKPRSFSRHERAEAGEPHLEWIQVMDNLLSAGAHPADQLETRPEAGTRRLRVWPAQHVELRPRRADRESSPCFRREWKGDQHVRRSLVLGVPKTSHHGRDSGREEGPGQAAHALARRYFSAGGAARGEHDQAGCGEAHPIDLVGIQRAGSLPLLRQQERRDQRVLPAGAGVCREVDHGAVEGLVQEGALGGLLADEQPSPVWTSATSPALPSPLLAAKAGR